MSRTIRDVAIRRGDEIRVDQRSGRVSDPAETSDRRSPGNPETCGRSGGSVRRPATAPLDAGKLDYVQLSRLPERVVN
jgi:hypothetical protein